MEPSRLGSMEVDRTKKLRHLVCAPGTSNARVAALDFEKSHQGTTETGNFLTGTYRRP
jgi:hypothetical protein